MSFESIEIKDTIKKILKQKTIDIHISIKKIWLFAQKSLDQSQQNQKKYANKNKKNHKLSIKKENMIVNKKYQNEKIIKKTERQTIKFFQNVKIEKK